MLCMHFDVVKFIFFVTIFQTEDELKQLAATNVKECGPAHHLSDEIIGKLHLPEDIVHVDVTDNVMVGIQDNSETFDCEEILIDIFPVL